MTDETDMSEEDLAERWAEAEPAELARNAFQVEIDTTIQPATRRMTTVHGMATWSLNRSFYEAIPQVTSKELVEAE